MPSGSDNRLTEPENNSTGRLMMSAGDAARVESDMTWWKDRLPPRWRLLGFTDRGYAAAISPTGRRVDIDGEFTEALHAATR